MKKFLLFAAAATVAASAMAEVFPKAVGMNGADITPAGYKFNTYGKEFIGAPNIYGTPSSANWQLGNNWYLNYSSKEGFDFGDGLIGLSCPNYTGPQYSEANYENFNKGCKIIDMGGTCGKVLAMNFKGSEFSEAYKAITGQALEIGEIPSGYTTPNLWLDPAVVSKYAGIKRDGKDYMPMRIRIELNIFANVQGSQAEVWKAFMQNDNGNVLPFGTGDNEAADITVKPSEFAYCWCEKDPTSPDDDSIWTEEEDGPATWNPERWMVYEWDFNAPDIENEGDPFCNVKIKNEIPGGESAITVLVRSINVYVPDNVDREYIYKKRPRTWNYYTVGESAGVNEIVSDAADAPAVYYNLQGVQVANPENGIYIVRRGSKVTKELVK